MCPTLSLPVADYELPVPVGGESRCESRRAFTNKQINNKMYFALFLIAIAQVSAHRSRPDTALRAAEAPYSDTPCTGDQWPRVCPGTLPAPATQSWQMNRSTIIMPCNYSGLTDPRTVADWAVTDWDW